MIRPGVGVRAQASYNQESVSAVAAAGRVWVECFQYGCCWRMIAGKSQQLASWQDFDGALPATMTGARTSAIESIYSELGGKPVVSSTTPCLISSCGSCPNRCVKRNGGCP